MPAARLLRVLERDAAQLGAASARSLNNVLASLRHCCNHPYLFDGAEPEPFVEGEHLVQASAKLALLDRLLRRLRARGDKVLLFCQSTRMLDVLRLLGQGLTTRDIAERLMVSPKTVETHRLRLKEALGVAHVGALVALGARMFPAAE